MSKQVSFYLLASDIVALESKLNDIEPYIVLHGRSESLNPRQLRALDPSVSGENWLYLFLVRTEDLKTVVMREVPAQGYWVVDGLYSSVIEFQQCFFDGNSLRRGRAYFVERYYGPNGVVVEKPESFRKWARSVLRTVKKHLHRRGPDYLGSDAMTWLSSGKGVFID